ncbi:MAG: hypothetical protein ACXIUM_12845 [Wenzhouxiangella sp.]
MQPISDFVAASSHDLTEKLGGHPGAITSWPENQQEAVEALLQRLVDLNHQRAAEEAQEQIRWLRSDYHPPPEGTAQQGKLETTTAEAEEKEAATTPATQTKHLWPKTLQDKIRAIRTELTTELTTDPTTAQALATRFKRNPEKAGTEALEVLSDLGMIEKEANKFRFHET